jgi:hypothetical protein
VRSPRFNQSRTWLLPALLGALVLRALLPGAGTPAAGAGLGYDSRMCSQIERQSESREAPAEDYSGPHCEYCIAPLLGAPLAHTPFHGGPPFADRLLARFVSQVPDAPLPRAQRARAPPRA